MVIARLAETVRTGCLSSQRGVSARVGARGARDEQSRVTAQYLLVQVPHRSARRYAELIIQPPPQLMEHL